MRSEETGQTGKSLKSSFWRLEKQEITEYELIENTIIWLSSQTQTRSRLTTKAKIWTTQGKEGGEGLLLPWVIIDIRTAFTQN